MTDEIKRLDPELATAPDRTSFLTAFVTKYGLLGMVIVGLGWLSYQQMEQNQRNIVAQMEQSQKTQQQLIQEFQKSTEAITRSNENQNRLLAWLERQERNKP